VTDQASSRLDIRPRIEVCERRIDGHWSQMNHRRVDAPFSRSRRRRRVESSPPTEHIHSPSNPISRSLSSLPTFRCTASSPGACTTMTPPEEPRVTRSPRVGSGDDDDRCGGCTSGCIIPYRSSTACTNVLPRTSTPGLYLTNAPAASCRVEKSFASPYVPECFPREGSSYSTPSQRSSVSSVRALAEDDAAEAEAELSAG
jgi:hypothetical protein